MTVNFNSVIRMMGMLLLVLGVAFLPAFVVALIYHEGTAAKSFLTTMLSSGIHFNKNIPPFSNPA